MNKIMKRSAALMAMFIAIVMCFVVLAPIVACGEKQEEKQPAEITALDKSALNLEAGASYTLKVTTSRALERDRKSTRLNSSH